MARKKIDETAQNGDDRITAPPLPKELSKQIKTTGPPSQITADQQVTVRRVSTTTPDSPAEPDIPSGLNLDNPETDQAVDDIMAEESDMVLAVDDIMANKRSQVVQTTGWRDKLRSLLHNKWTWISLAVIICILMGLPWTRYKIIGLIIKPEVSVTVIDSQTDTPVSDAHVSLAGVAVKTDANGLAKLRAGVGEQSLTISKQYYRTADSHYFVGFKDNKLVSIKLVATGRLVPITINNVITNKPLAGVIIHILNTTAKTNAKGQASIALPTISTSDRATLSLTGYNTEHVNVQVTASAVAANNLTLTPSGSIYFLSNVSGIINVMKSNLDGSNPQTVLTGTGHEIASTTRLLASADWQYLVLEANRSGTGPALYLINTANDQVTEFDSSNSVFDLIGWYSHDFIYSLTSNTADQSQSGSQVLKDYNADQHELNQLDQNQVIGTSTSYAYQSFSNFFLVGSNILYDTEWTAAGGYDLSSQNDTIRAFELSLETTKDYESFPANSTGSINAARYQPQAVYFAVPGISGITYYQYSNQTVQVANINQAIFNQTSPTYLSSPSDNQTVWSELSNGQDVFLKGSANATNQQQIAALNGIVPYGWYTDNYILASKGSTQLYILPASGSSGTEQPLKITNYYEPDKTNAAYEYGGF